VMDQQNLVDDNRAALVRMVALHAAKLLESNDESCGDAQESNAGGRPRPAWSESDKPAGRLMNRAAPIKPRMMATHKTRRVDDAAELVNAGSVTSVIDSPPED
jgi:hypothetical protein